MNDVLIPALMLGGIFLTLVCVGIALKIVLDIRRDMLDLKRQAAGKIHVVK
jgi:hypothetical protein